MKMTEEQRSARDKARYFFKIALQGQSLDLMRRRTGTALVNAAQLLAEARTLGASETELTVLADVAQIEPIELPIWRGVAAVVEKLSTTIDPHPKPAKQVRMGGEPANRAPA